MRSKLNKFELGMGVSGPEGSRYSEVPCPEGSMSSGVLCWGGGKRAGLGGPCMVRFDA